MTFEEVAEKHNCISDIRSVIKEELKNYCSFDGSDLDGVLVIDLGDVSNYRFNTQEFYQFMKENSERYEKFINRFSEPDSDEAIWSMVERYIAVVNSSVEVEAEELLAQNINVAVINALEHNPAALEMWKEMSSYKKMNQIFLCGYNGVEFDLEGVVDKTPKEIREELRSLIKAEERNAPKGESR